MKNTHYSNTEREFEEILSFLNTLSNIDPYVYWEPVRMIYWQYNLHGGKKSADPFFMENVRIWRNANQDIVGLCISEYGKNDIFIEILPDYIELFSEIAEWIEQTWAKEKPVIEIDVYSENLNKINRLETRGFSFVKHFENKRTYDLSKTDLKYTLRDGYSIQAFSEMSNYKSRVDLVCSAFNNYNVSYKNIKALLASPYYNDDYHLCVVSPEKQYVAYCIGWKETSRESWGYIEPVGTHADFRRQGFAKAVIQECFNRMKTDGIDNALISSYAEPAIANFLYDSLSPITKKKVFKFRKCL